MTCVQTGQPRWVMRSQFYGPVPLCVHTGFIQAEHINCVIWKALILGWSSWTSWANLTLSSPVIKLITEAGSCAMHFSGSYACLLIIRKKHTKKKTMGPMKWETECISMPLGLHISNSSHLCFCSSMQLRLTTSWFKTNRGLNCTAPPAAGGN